MPLYVLLCALALSWTAQWELRWARFEEWLPLAWGLCAIAGALAWRLSNGTVPDAGGESDWVHDSAPRATGRLGAWVVVAVVSMVATALLLLLRDLRSPTGTVLWALSLPAIPLALAWREGRLRRPRAAGTRAGFIIAAATLALVAGSFALRMHQIDSIPAKFLDDEGSVADWGLNYLEGRPFHGHHGPEGQPIFRNAFPAQPLLGSVVHVLPVYLTGTTITGARLMPAIAGALTVGVFFLILLREVRPWAAFAAAFLLAVCHTHLYWSRSGNLQSLTTLTLCLSIGFLLAGIRSGSLAAAAAAGVLLGLAQYFYEGARFFVLVYLLFFAAMMLAHPGRARRWILQAVVLGAAAAVVAAPIGFWYVAHPGELLGRSRGVWIFGGSDYIESRYPGLDTPGVILAQLRRALEGFAIRGDGSSFYALRAPIVDPVTRGLLLTGLGALFALRPPVRILTCLWLWVPILIVCIPTVDPPSMTRLAPALPAVFVVVALVLDRLGHAASAAGGRRGSGVLWTAVAAALVYATIWNTSNFFGRYPRENVADAQTIAGIVARQAGPTYKILVVGNPFDAWSASVRYPARGLAAENIRPAALPIPERGWRNGLLFIRLDDSGTLERARAVYPRAPEQIHRDGRGVPLFHTFRVSAEDLNRAAPLLAAWKTPDARFAHLGEGPGEVTEAHALAVDQRGFVYVASGRAPRVEVFDADGRSAFRIGRGNGSPEGAGRILGLTFLHDDSLLALYSEAPHLRRFTPDGRSIAAIEPTEPLTQPVGIAASPSGFYVVDSGTARVQHLDTAGRVLASLGRPGLGRGEFSTPAAVTVAAGGEVFVFDQGNNRIQRFTADLAYEGEWHVAAGDQSVGQALATSPADPDHVYFANPSLGVVQRFRLDGTPSWAVGQRGDYAGQLGHPIAVAVDSRGNVFVLDLPRGPVLRYDLSRRLNAERRK